MAVTDQQKLDFLLKKIGYTKTKTGSVVGTGAISGTPKQPFAEAIPSPLVVPNSSLWNEASSIPATPPGSDTPQVKVYLAASSGLRMTADSTSSGQRAYIAYSTYGNTSSARLTNWIDTQFGAGYLIKVYKGDPNSGGVALSAAGSGANDGWFFDYSAGVLNFNDTSVPSGVTDTNIYIVGYRYIGQTGAPTSGISTFSHLDLTVERNLDVGKQGGISTFRHNVQLLDNAKINLGTGNDVQLYWDGGAGFVTNQGGGNLHFNSDTVLIKNAANSKSYIRAYNNSSVEIFHNNNKKFETTVSGINVTGDGVFSGNVSIGGTLTYEDVKNVDAVGLITARSGIRVTGGVIEAQAGENKIPSLYSNMGALPSAGSYHGMFAHVHATGRGYFAHAGNWYELVNKETNGTVGTGTETYDIGGLTATAIDLNGDLDVDGHTELDNVNITGFTTFATGTRFFHHTPRIEMQGSNTATLSFVNATTGTTNSDGMIMGFSSNSQAGFINVNESAHGFILKTGGSGVGNERINISGVGTVSLRHGTSEEMVTARPNGAVELYHNGIKRLETSSVGISIPQDLDVDGHTNLDNVSVAGVSTFSSSTGSVVISEEDDPSLTFISTSGIQTANRYRLKVGGGRLNLQVSANNGASYVAAASIGGIGNIFIPDNDKVYFGTNNDAYIVHDNSDLNIVNTTGNIDVTGNVVLNNDLDVDGHTNLDNVSIAGVTSVASLTSGRVVTAGTGGKLQDSNNLTFDGTNLFVSGINVTGGGATSILGADIVTRNLKATGLSTFVGQSEFDGNAKFDSTITAGGSVGTNGQYLKTTGSGVEWATFPTLRTRQTFTASSGQTAFSFSYTINFIDVFVNGIKLTDAEFTATNGSTVVLAVGCFVGDIVELVSYNTVSGGGGGGGGGGGISNVVEDTTPQLGGNLDLFNKSITGTGNVNITGIISATSFKGPSGVTATFIGDGSGLTGITATGSGVVIKDDNNVVGTAGTINFGDNLSVSPASAGIVTVGFSSASLNVNKLNVTGITTFVGITSFSERVDFRGGNNNEVWFWAHPNLPNSHMVWRSDVGGGNGGLYLNNSNVLFGVTGQQARTHIDQSSSNGFKVEQYMDYGDNPLRIRSDYTHIAGSPTNAHSSRDIAEFNYIDGCSLYFNDAKKLQTCGVGVTITSQLDVTNINASGVTTTTEVRSNALSLKNADGSATYATFSNGGATVLKWNNTDRLETTTSGVTVTGTVAATSYTGDGSQLTGIGAGSTANIITNNLQVLGISTFIGIATFAGEVQTGTGATVGIGSTAYVHKIAFASLPNSNNTLTAALGESNSKLTFTGNGVQNGVWGNTGLKIAGNGSSTNTGPEANCTLEVVSSENTRVLFKGSANTGLDFDSSSPNNGVANYIRSDKDIIFYTGYGSSGLSTNFKIGEREGSTFYNSVGIRTNYYPLGAVSISMDAISGIVTATKFVGDGSGLTNLPGGGSYGNNDVDNHLNVSGASSGQILSWNGSDYAWVNDQTGGGGGGTDVGITTNLSGSFTASAGTPATINTFAYHDNDKVVEYTVYIKNGSDFQTQKLLAMRDGTTIHSTQFAVIFSSSLLVQCDATISSGNILLRATPETGVSGSTTYKIKREVM